MHVFLKQLLSVSQILLLVYKVLSKNIITRFIFCVFADFIKQNDRTTSRSGKGSTGITFIDGLHKGRERGGTN